MSNSWIDQQAALAGYFVAQWPTFAPGVRLVRRNGPALDPAPNPKTESWVRLSILTGFSFFPCVGSRRSRDPSRVEVQIFTPLGGGDGRSRSLGDAVRLLWDTAAVSGALPGVLLGAPEFVPIGKDPELPFWADLVSTPVLSDHLP